MTKQQEKQIQMIKAHMAAGNNTSAANIISAMIRSASNNKQAQELKAIAVELKLV